MFFFSYFIFQTACESTDIIASYPGSSQFFNDARRKTREPGKIHHVRDVKWKGLGKRAHSLKNIAHERSLVYLHFLLSWPVRACDDSSCLAQLSFRCASPSKRLICVRCAKSLPPDVTHVMNFTRLSCFSACIVENWEEPGYEARVHKQAHHCRHKCLCRSVNH